MTAPKKIALFDFDGTITYKNSMFDFIDFYRGRAQFYFGLIALSPMLVLHRAGIISAQKAKEKMLTYFFKNELGDVFIKKGNDYSLNRLPQIVKQSALDEIYALKERGFTIFIVSASADTWLKSWCEKMSVELISTELEIKDNKVTGKLLGKNCNGLEKAVKIKNVLAGSDHTIETAYGDSSGDKEMLALAKQSFYRHFD